MILLLSSLFTAMADSYKVDPIHSGVFFRVKHFDVGYTYGRFNDISGKVKTETSLSSIELSIKAESVDSNNARRDRHLQGPDFLDAKQFPTIIFTSSSITSAGENNFTVQGELVLHGHTQPLTITLEQTGQGEDSWGNERIGYEASFSINRSDFGMEHMQNSISDTVYLMVAFEAIKQ